MRTNRWFLLLAVATALSVGVLAWVKVQRSADSLQGELAAWRATSDPLTLDELDLEVGPGTPLDELSFAIADLRDGAQAGGSPPGPAPGKVLASLADAGRLSELDPSDADRIRAVVEDRAEVLALVGGARPLAAVRWNARFDAAEEATGLTFGERAFAALPILELGQVLALRAVLRALDGGDVTADLDALWEVADGLAGAPELLAASVRAVLVGSGLTVLTAVAPSLDRAALESQRDRLRAIDLTAGLRAAIVGERVIAHRTLSLVRGTLDERELPAAHPARRQIPSAPSWMSVFTGAGIHAEVLSSLAEALARLDAHGLEIHRAGDLAEWEPAEPRGKVAAFLQTFAPLGAVAGAADAAARIEARRRLALCGLGYALDGEAGLAVALASYPDPLTGGPFERVTSDDGAEVLRSPGGGAVPIEWPLWSSAARPPGEASGQRSPNPPDSDPR